MEQLLQYVSAYCRVSTDSDDQLNSLDYQTSYFEDYINKRSDYTFYRVYADEGLSGTSWDKRRLFQEMLYDAGLDILEYRGELTIRDSDRTSKFTRILVKDVSRWARDVGSLDVLKRLKQRGVFVDFITANLTTESMSDDILVGLMMLLAESDSKDKSTKVVFGHAQGAARGKILNADNLHGYRYNEDRTSLVIIPEEAETIRYIFDLYISGEGFRNISNRLAEEGIRTRTGKIFGTSTLNRIIRNHAYKGDLVRNKYDAPRVFDGRKSASLRSEDEWIVHEGRFPAIISAEIFEKAREARVSRINYDEQKGKKSNKSRYAHFLSCKICKGSYHSNRDSSKKGGGIYYVCSKKKREGVRTCNAPNIREDIINELLWTIDRKRTQGWLDNHINALVSYIQHTEKSRLLADLDRDSEKDILERESKIKEFRAENKRLTYLFMKGKIQESDYDELSSELDTSIESLTAEVRQLSRSNDDIYEDLSELDRIVAELQSLEMGGTIFEFMRSIEVVSNHSIFVTFDLGDIVKKKINSALLSKMESVDDLTVSTLISK